MARVTAFILFSALVMIFMHVLGCSFSNSGNHDQSSIEKVKESADRYLVNWPFLKDSCEIYSGSRNSTNINELHYYCEAFYENEKLMLEFSYTNNYFPLNQIIDSKKFNVNVQSVSDAEKYLNKFLWISSYGHPNEVIVETVEDVENAWANFYKDTEHKSGIKNILATNKEILKKKMIKSEWMEDERGYQKKCTVYFLLEYKYSSSGLVLYLENRFFHIDKQTGHVRVETDTIFKSDIPN